MINKNKENDGTCDCPNCKDEMEGRLDCGECDCPNTCGESVDQCKYRCEGESLCLIDSSYFNDGEFCDCPNCDDERDSGFICSNQPGGFCDCPSSDECGTDFSVCLGTRRLATNLSLADAPAQVIVTPPESKSPESKSPKSPETPRAGRHVTEVTLEAAMAIRSALQWANKARGKGTAEERLRKELAAAFEGADQGMLHTVSGHLRHQVLHIALQGALGLLGSDAELRRRVSLVFSDGPPLKQARHVAPKGFQEEELPKELGERGTKPPAPAPPKSPETSEKSGKKKTGRKGPPSKHVDVVDLIIEQMLRMAFPNKSLTFAQQLLKTLRHDRGKAPVKAPPSDVGQDAAAGGDQGRQLQAPNAAGGAGRPDIPGQLIPEDAFLCPDVEDCPLPRYFRNNRKCDCPVTCADEDAFDCENCVPKVPFGFTGPQQQAAATLGSAVGVSMGAAIGIAVGVGVGLATAIGVSVAIGTAGFVVPNAQEFTTSAPVQEGMKNALARLGKVDGGADAVTLNWETGRRLENVWHSVPMAQHRELAEKVKLSFEIETKGEEEGLQLCEVLTDIDEQGATKVMIEELEAAGAPIDFQLVSWEPEPNPKSYNPTQLMPGGGGKKRSFVPDMFQPGKPSFFGKGGGQGIDFG